MPISSCGKPLARARLTEEKIMEYLELLENADQFTIDEENDRIKSTSES